MRLPLGDEFDIDKIYRNFDNKMEELESVQAELRGCSYCQIETEQLSIITYGEIACRQNEV